MVQLKALELKKRAASSIQFVGSTAEQSTWPTGCPAFWKKKSTSELLMDTHVISNHTCLLRAQKTQFLEAQAPALQTLLNVKMGERMHRERERERERHTEMVKRIRAYGVKRREG